MNSDLEISQWLCDAKAGNAEAVAQLWAIYFPQLVRFARQKLAGVPQQMANEEDVALSAFKSFCKAAEQGRFPNLHDREELWQLLFKMTSRKAVDLRRKETCDRRGGGKTLNEVPHDADSSVGGLDQFPADENTPEFVALMAEACEEWLKVLTPQLRDLALAKLEGDTNREAAARLNTTERAVEYGLKVIRKKWTALESRESE
jgi:DNA-directed RNA polymerase specialized sigma24 family protein